MFFSRFFRWFVLGSSVGLAGCMMAPPADGTPTDFTAAFTEETDTVQADSSSFRLSADETTLTYALSVSGLSGPAVAAHFHNAPSGQDGPIVIDLGASIVNGPGDGTTTVNGSTLLADWSLTNAATALRNGSIYINVHTGAFPAGEIRGQLTIAE